MKALRVAVSLVGVIGLVLVVPILDESSEVTFGGIDSRLLFLEVGAALALLAVAALAPPRPASALVAVVGAAWLLPELAGGVGVPLAARTVGDAIAPLLVASLLAGIVLGSGRLDAASRAAVVVTLAGAMVATIARLLLMDPFYDVSCWRACEHNPLLLADPAVGDVTYLVGILGMTTGVAWAASRHVAKRRRRGALLADAGGWLVLLGLILSLVWAAPPSSGRGLAVALIAQVAAIGWLAALCRETWLRWRLESRLAQWVGLLGSRRGEPLADSLRGALNDPDLQVAYWAPTQGSYVDAHGRPCSSESLGAHERVTTVTRRGQTVARIVHHRRVDGARLERAFGPALSLALENEQLRAVALSELDELTRSRTRVVERAAVERRRLERNLHDGAQQRAVTLALLVRLLPAPGPTEQETKTRAEALTRTLTEELRRVARGIYPAVLTDAGLRGAVADLAEGSSELPVVVTEFPEGRYPGTVESTAYLVVHAALAGARRLGATCAEVSGRHTEGELRICIVDDAAGAHERIGNGLVDQVSALGGQVDEVESPGLYRLKVTLPCAS
jgi:signal transduction histidine kinase